MPADAYVNGLQLSFIPDPLNCLNKLEKLLISVRIPLMKIIQLPKGNQRRFVGPCVSIPTDIEKTNNVLPRCDNEAELIRCKLKRKLEYKGYSQYEFVSRKKYAKEILDQHFDHIFCVAPGEGNTPVSMLQEEDNEGMSFPVQFPEGSFGSYDTKRLIPLTRSRYFHARLFSADSRFSSDTSYIFYAQYLSELEQRLRVKKTEHYLPGDHCILKSCLQHSVPLESLHIFATSKEIDSHKGKMIAKVCEVTETLMAQDYDRNPRTGELILKTSPYDSTHDYAD
ncbi:unnamed protein product [Mytilus coruscus]|uniref:DUF6570 domain-containing protein n=1 Tax=Mytilus coruscus TaxID=42192 RepID=A0A6J8AVJ2_MYTCO|nr:unnamed protein product [Mytilus coruscus]